MNVKLITLLFLLCASYQVTANLTGFYTSAGTFEKDFELIAPKLQTIFDENSSEIVIDSVQSYLQRLLDIEPSTEAVAAPAMCIQKDFDNTLFFTADDGFEAYHFSYFKLINGFNESRPRSTNNFGVTIESGWKLSLLTIAGTTNDIRSGLYIIIIDKEIARCDSDRSGSPQYASRNRNQSNHSIKEAAPVELHSFPNPTLDQTLLRFQLDKAQNVSLQLVNLSTARIVARKLENQFLPEGNHQYGFDMQSYPAGNYLIVLKMNDQFRSVPIVKIE